uniref:Alpha/beta hydrolase fold-3 domain-containing protein n=1 Tax=Haptolina brevifila TaxID=156173 RepID=A0A7S2JV05_9EUKA
MGDSAGGNLAISTLLRAARAGGERPAGLVLISPWVDLTDASLSAPSMHACQSTDFLPLRLIKSFRDDYVYGGDGSAANDAADPLISPAHAQLTELASALPPTLVTFGTGEELQDQQRAFIDKLQQAHVPLTTYEQLGMPHIAPIFAAAAYGASKPRCSSQQRLAHSDGGGLADGEAIGDVAAPSDVESGAAAARMAPQLNGREAPREAPPPVEALNRIERFIEELWWTHEMDASQMTGEQRERSLISKPDLGVRELV